MCHFMTPTLVSKVFETIFRKHKGNKSVADVRDAKSLPIITELEPIRKQKSSAYSLRKRYVKPHSRRKTFSRANKSKTNEGDINSTHNYQKIFENEAAPDVNSETFKYNDEVVIGNLPSFDLIELDHRSKNNTLKDLRGEKVIVDWNTPSLSLSNESLSTSYSHQNGRVQTDSAEKAESGSQQRQNDDDIEDSRETRPCETVTDTITTPRKHDDNTAVTDANVIDTILDLHDINTTENTTPSDTGDSKTLHIGGPEAIFDYDFGNFDLGHGLFDNSSYEDALDLSRSSISSDNNGDSLAQVKVKKLDEYTSLKTNYSSDDFASIGDIFDDFDEQDDIIPQTFTTKDNKTVIDDKSDNATGKAYFEGNTTATIGETKNNTETEFHDDITCYPDLANFEADIVRPVENSHEANPMMPILKQELQYKLQLDRLIRGEDELILEPEQPKQFKLREDEVKKKNARKEQNRRSAKKSRAISRQYEMMLKHTVNARSLKNGELTREKEQLLKEKTALENLLNEHQQCCATRNNCKETN